MSAIDPAVDDLELARQLAERTGEILREVRADVGYADRWTLMNAGDRAAQDYLGAALAAARPDDAVLSEEAPDDLARLTADRVWIIDPVDGTSAYGYRGSDEWAVHVALWERGSLVVGVVSRPATGEMYDSATARQLPLRHPDELRIVCSRSRTTSFVRAVARDVGADLVDMSSAGIKALAVLTGEADAYLHTGGQHQWDNAAPVAVALGAGLIAERVDGSPIVYNERSTSIDDLLICRPEVHDELRAAIDAHAHRI
ncbi:3'(2'),5'-bisphosphate nucleotidase CysQ [Cumulibacter manganitolerans]|uniref:3'(2'),5'-bisphosphate nucleotidase CysQ n=1 Tax=Cumulibacter manganitolerans TaxID=1884992 RepID=UPI001E3255F8|nr:3'(2'),5'-bisphosphate nucleotidase CysQ [Cumulibacter manganitolerans]